jgi:iron complex outermembrane receptor protein
VLGGAFGNDRLYQKYDAKVAGRPGRVDYFARLGHFQTDGYRLHSEARYTSFNSRLRYNFDASSELTLVVNYADTPLAESPSSLTDSLARAKPDTARDIALSPAQCPPDPGFAGCQDLGEESRQGQVGINYRRRLGAEHRLSLMAYGLNRRLTNRIPFTLIELDRLAGGARVEYRYVPLAGRLTGLTAGVDLDSQADDRLESERDAEQTGPVSLDQDERVTALGLFAQAGVELLADLELTLSLRYDRVTFQVDDRLVSAGDPDDSGRRDMDQLSPMAGLRYAFAPWLSAYANVGRSFQTPTTTELTDSLGGFDESLQPERAVSYELGLKGTASERVSYTLAAFWSDIDGLIVGSAVPGTERVFFDNAGSADHRGLELGFSALITQGLVFTAAYTHAHFVFEDFRSDDDFSGNRLPGVPPNQLHGSFNYNHPIGFAGALQVWGVEGYYVDNANEDRNDGYVTANIRLGYSLNTRSLEVLPMLGVNNLFDTRYNSSVVVNAVAGAFYEPAPGRNFYVGLRVKTR